jgi:hypothetical protein
VPANFARMSVTYRAGGADRMQRREHLAAYTI